MFLAWIFEPMARVTHFGCIKLFCVLFLIDTHARTISDDMDDSNFEHNVYCPESLGYSLDVMFHLQY